MMNAGSTTPRKEREKYSEKILARLGGQPHFDPQLLSLSFHLCYFLVEESLPAKKQFIFGILTQSDH